MLKIIMNKAGNGDCISIESRTEFVLIDGGTAQSFLAGNLMLWVGIRLIV